MEKTENLCYNKSNQFGFKPKKAYTIHLKLSGKQGRNEE